MQRLPPNQRLRTDFPILHFGKVPEFDRETWDFRIEGLVENPIRLTFDEFMVLEKTVDVSDFHCVTGWSKFDLKWEGVRFSDIAKLARPGASARFATIEAEGGYTTSLPLEELMEPDVIFAYGFDGKPLEPIHGGPLRFVIPKKYAYKSAKWVRRVIFTYEQEPGFWEARGYSNSADPWKEERYSY
ncbi:MAG: sulfite oxidase-like oxidoreductase [Candidatus Methanoperedens sp.]|nr:sulfite oxidase-like oxidoreductase [Candidatus Methanoperedens sp.]MCE8424740.1 sulfite oxidase-like oxidoreductase [Candidatus Methanoperedens sp.]MCE8428323.1 sulfite oxidase-like oxidoreductase [Candidatus Methanoperedens sp.]